MMSLRAFTPRRQAPVIAEAALLALGLAAATLHPGWHSYDSAWKLMQARTRAYSSLQPPAMPLAWSVRLKSTEKWRSPQPDFWLALIQP